MLFRMFLSILFVLIVSPLVRADKNNTAPTHDVSKWYDVTEWFSNNDYHPSDEAIERVSADAKKTHTPNLYIDRDDDGEYEIMVKFFDSDGNGVNDTTATYTDTNEDGTYDKVSYRSTLAGELLGKNEQVFKTEDLGKFTGRRGNVTGKVLEVNFETKDAALSEWVMKVQGNNGKEMLVNLGNDGAFQLFKGDTISVWGPLMKVGDQTVLVATELETAGKQRQVVHHGRKYSGIVQSTQETTVGDEKHLVAKIKTDTGKMVTVDLAHDQHDGDIKTGQRIAVSGVPIELDDRTVLMAISVDLSK